MIPNNTLGTLKELKFWACYHSHSQPLMLLLLVIVDKFLYKRKDFIQVCVNMQWGYWRMQWTVFRRGWQRPHTTLSQLSMAPWSSRPISGRRNGLGQSLLFHSLLTCRANFLNLLILLVKSSSSLELNKLWHISILSLRYCAHGTAALRS